MELKIKFVGYDDWSRPVYKTEKGTFLKNVDIDGEPTVHNLNTAGSFDGEPIGSIKKDFKIVEVEKF